MSVDPSEYLLHGNQMQQKYNEDSETITSFQQSDSVIQSHTSSSYQQSSSEDYGRVFNSKDFARRDDRGYFSQENLRDNSEEESERF